MKVGGFVLGVEDGVGCEYSSGIRSEFFCRIQEPPLMLLRFCFFRVILFLSCSQIAALELLYGNCGRIHILL